MSNLIAVVTAHSRKEWADAVRTTWMPQVPRDKADAKFFVGHGRSNGPLPPDTVELDCNDSYSGLPGKIKAIARYAYSNGYQYVLKLDDDVVIRPSELLSSDFDQHPYSGRTNRAPFPEQPYWVPMGFCYWMNRDCMRFVSEAELPPDQDDERWIAETLHKQGIALHHIGGLHLHRESIDVKQRLAVAPRPLRPLRKTYVELDYERDACSKASAVAIALDEALMPKFSTQHKVNEFFQVWDVLKQ